MQNLVIYILSLITAFADMYAINYLNKNKANVKKLLFYIIGLSLIFFANELIVNSSIKPLLSLMLLSIINIILYKNDFIKSIINSLCVLIITAMGEIIFTIIVYLIFGSIIITKFAESFIGLILCNIMISISIILFVRVPIVRRTYNKVLYLSEYIKEYKLVINMLIFFVTIVILFNALYENYYNNKLIIYLLVTFIFLFYTASNLLTIFITGKYNNILNKYSMSLENIDVYEDMINKYRIMNHENKNELLLIRNMSKNKKIQRYIDELINNNEEDNKLIMNRIKRVPSVQIRALLYTKILKMEKNNLNCSLVIGRKVSSKLFLNMNNKEIVDICNILNVLLDNAIDACVNSKERNIIIEFNNYENIEICISNSYSGTIDVNQIYNIGYTTKGKGHGYGLPLVKKIINSNNYIDINTQKINDYFVQTVIIKKSID